MGIIYCGPYADEINAGYNYPHEGYAARKMPDGTLTGTWGGEYGWDNHVGFVAACDCGWTGATVHPTGDYECEGYKAAEAEWDREHLQPMIARAAGTYWPMWAKRTASQADKAASCVAAGRYADAAVLLGLLVERAQAALRTAEDLAAPAGRML